jgi:predicted DNA-binding transcriptional regulator YafY
MKNYTEDIKRRSELLAKIIAGEKLSKADAAFYFGVTEVTINRYLKFYRDNGLPIFSKKNCITITGELNERVLIEIASDYIPLKLNSDVFHKKVKVFAEKSGLNFFPKLILLTKAVNEGIEIIIDYTRLSDGVTSKYCLQPIRLINDDLNWILHAMKKNGTVIQSFYLSRIENVTLSNTKFKKQNIPVESAKMYDMEFKFDKKVYDELQFKIWFEDYKVTQNENHTILKTRQTISNALASWCISWWDTIEVVQPVDLKNYISEMINLFQTKNTK